MTTIILAVLIGLTAQLWIAHLSGQPAREALTTVATAVIIVAVAWALLLLWGNLAADTVAVTP